MYWLIDTATGHAILVNSLEEARKHRDYLVERGRDRGEVVCLDASGAVDLS